MKSGKISVKNIINRAMGGLLLVCLAMTFTLLNATTARAASGQWYSEVLNTKSGTFKVKNIYGKQVTCARKSFDHYRVIDINGDGVKELILTDASYSWLYTGTKKLILTYYKGSVKPLLYIPNQKPGIIYYKKNAIIFAHKTEDEEIYEVYKLNQGRLEKKIKLCGDDYANKYKKNGKTCSKKTYRNEYNRYVENAKELEFAPIKVKTSLKAKIIPLLSGKWYANSSRYKNTYRKFTSKELIIYERYSNKVQKRVKISSIKKVNGKYRLYLGEGPSFYEFEIKNNKIENLYYMWHSGESIGYSGGSSLTKDDPWK